MDVVEDVDVDVDVVEDGDVVLDLDRTGNLTQPAYLGSFARISRTAFAAVPLGSSCR
jgi:hypothetical protein